jgi:hypothetical protein
LDSAVVLRSHQAAYGDAGGYEAPEMFEKEIPSHVVIQYQGDTGQWNVTARPGLQSQSPRKKMEL